MFDRYKNILIGLWSLMSLFFMVYFFLNAYQEDQGIIKSILGGFVVGLIVSAFVALVFLIIVMLNKGTALLRQPKKWMWLDH